MGDMEYMPNPTLQVEESSPTSATVIGSVKEKEERPNHLAIKDKNEGSRRSDHSPTLRTPAVMSWNSNEAILSRFLEKKEYF